MCVGGSNRGDAPTPEPAPLPPPPPPPMTLAAQPILPKNPEEKKGQKRVVTAAERRRRAAGGVTGKRKLTIGYGGGSGVAT